MGTLDAVEIPLNERKFHTFLSHASADKLAVVDDLYGWLTAAGLEVWYDREDIVGGNFVSRIAEGIGQCRSVLLVLSEASAESPWVKKEFTQAEKQALETPGFRLVIVRVGDPKMPVELETYNYLQMSADGPSEGFLLDLMKRLYGVKTRLERGLRQDVYVSLGWMPSEEAFVRPPLDRLDQHNLRLVGDSQDHPSFTDSRERIAALIQSCGAAVGIAPLRLGKRGDEYQTSKYIWIELGLAQAAGLPTFLVREEGVTVPDEISDRLVMDFEAPIDADLEELAAEVSGAWQEPPAPAHAFLAASFAEDEAVRHISEFIETTLGVRCVIGQGLEALGTRSVQEEIVDEIRDAFLVVADISPTDEGVSPVNSLIEVGIARGARTPYLLLRGPSGAGARRPFLVRDREVLQYRSVPDAMAIVHRHLYRFRRRIFNTELAE